MSGGNNHFSVLKKQFYPFILIDWCNCVYCSTIQPIIWILNHCHKSAFDFYTAKVSTCLSLVNLEHLKRPRDVCLYKQAILGSAARG